MLGLNEAIMLATNFTVNNTGNLKDSFLKMAKTNFYMIHPMILVIFEKLMEKYTALVKTKEEMVKYILRKVFKAIEN